MRPIRHGDPVRSVEDMAQTAPHSVDRAASMARAVLLAILGNILVFVVIALAAAGVLAAAILVFGPALMRLV